MPTRPPIPMRTYDFDFHLPEEQIAQRPLPRGTSRLLVLPTGEPFYHQTIADLPGLLRPGDLLVANDTRVIPARLFGRRRQTGGRAELLLLEKRAPRRWRAMARPAKRLRIDTVIDLDGAPVDARVVGRWQDWLELELSAEIEPFLDVAGHVPLPPYIRRDDDADDRQTYQTVFARHDGAVAAPTAGLHFDQALLGRLRENGIEHVAVTLHVGPGTFRPVSVDDVAEHTMDEERYVVSPSAAEAIHTCKARGGRVVAVGTTVVRALESAALASDEEGNSKIPVGDGRTRLFITPGFRFRVVDLLVTNFHLPRSTLLMLVSAFAGRRRVLDAYGCAIEAGYRFYSYGDAMLCERNDGDGA